MVGARRLDGRPGVRRLLGQGEDPAGCGRPLHARVRRQDRNRVRLDRRDLRGRPVRAGHRRDQQARADVAQDREARRRDRQGHPPRGHVQDLRLRRPGRDIFRLRAGRRDQGHLGDRAGRVGGPAHEARRRQLHLGRAVRAGRVRARRRPDPLHGRRLRKRGQPAYRDRGRRAAERRDRGLQDRRGRRRGGPRRGVRGARRRRRRHPRGHGARQGGRRRRHPGHRRGRQGVVQAALPRLLRGQGGLRARGLGARR